MYWYCNFQTLVTFYLEVESKGRQLLRNIPVVVHLKQNQSHLKLQRAREKMNQNQHLLGEGILHCFCLEPLVKFCIAKVSSGKRYQNCNGCVMVSMLAVSAVNRGFQPGRVKPKIKKSIFAASCAKHIALRGKNKDWLAQNWNNLSEWSEISIRGLLFQ